MANERKARLGGCDEEGLGNQDEKEEELEEEEEQDNSSEIELRDATVKLLRLLANLTIDGTIGTTIAESNETISILLELLVCSTSGGSDAVKVRSAFTPFCFAPLCYFPLYSALFCCVRTRSLHSPLCSVTFSLPFFIKISSTLHTVVTIDSNLISTNSIVCQCLY